MVSIGHDFHVYIHFRDNIETGSLIISSQVAVPRGDDVLSTPVTIDFDILVENFTDPVCVFWNFSFPYVHVILYPSLSNFALHVVLVQEDGQVKE